MKVLLSLLLGVIFSISAYAEIKIGYVDLQSAIEMTTTGKKAKKKVEKSIKSKKAQLEKKEEELKKRMKDFEKKSAVLSNDVRMERQKGLQQEYMQLQELFSKSQVDLKKQENQLLQPILKVLEKELKKMAEGGKFTVILEKGGNSVLYADKSIDLTKQLVKAYEKNK